MKYWEILQSVGKVDYIIGLVKIRACGKNENTGSLQQLLGRTSCNEGKNIFFTTPVVYALLTEAMWRASFPGSKARASPYESEL